MSKRKLCMTLSNFLRRTTSIPQNSTLNFSSPQIKLSPSPFETQIPNFHKPTFHYNSLGFLRFSGERSWCSKSAEKLQSSSRCWNCDAFPTASESAAPFLFCESCQCIQPVDYSIDYFQIFGLEKKYDIEDKNLEGKYKDWQKKLHPDLVHSKSQKERDFAAEQSARVIDAYRTLRTPLSRGIYMLKLDGVEVDEEKTISDPDLLAEIMEIREEVEEATNSETLNYILSQMQEKMKNWSTTFADAFQSQNFEEAKTSIQRMTYYSRVMEEVVKKL
ncbi:PREDICTED: iron-sulfur cluster co-chaperone protein HscB, mitochondrial-like [Lupinus angustifolius]|nr:PREDICTED: iron-sulfur cluster co-chaperone protein HscB, mitochondrial-like [Lupinus angustifolius]XP_019443104.1 PREDICTED: iron-sulfur cluster co-chaperone protein HscB, mitochondrial-like [Lupinus angustifolius]XP_019443106.1 PREDICTED: iron-sulfur cluster co-chaperone protein HscB, mitochondrial-like [Lupinus angustifolius]